MEEVQEVQEVQEEQTAFGFSGAAPVEASPPEETAGFGFATAAAVQQEAPAEEPSGFGFGPNAGKPAFGGLFEGGAPAEDATGTTYGF